MGETEKKIEALLRSSKTVLIDCVLENGAIVATNSDKPYSHPEGNDYRYVWGRDAAFILYALHLLGQNASKDFANWLLERAESFEERGLFCRKYATNGSGSFYHDEYQPDQAGTLLWSFSQTESYKHASVRKAATSIANALCASWHTDRFIYETYDLWEHHIAAADSEPFIYSVAASMHGLRAAAPHAPSEAIAEKWLHVAREMEHVINASVLTRGWFSRREGEAIDASMTGLIWPTSCGSETQQRATLGKILHTLGSSRGIKRFEGDVYDSVVHGGIDDNKGAGTWPLLSCWAVIALHHLGETSHATSMFERLTQQIDGTWIPEQILSRGRKGVTPLGWSHAMYVITAHELGFLESKKYVIVD